MEIGNSKRKLLAESLTKAAEYIFALLILGQFIAGKTNVVTVILSAIIYISMLGIAMFVMPEQKEGL